MYLVQVKKPDESKYKYDYYKVVTTSPGEQAFSSHERRQLPRSSTLKRFEGIAGVACPFPSRDIEMNAKENCMTGAIGLYRSRRHGRADVPQPGQQIGKTCHWV